MTRPPVQGGGDGRGGGRGCCSSGRLRRSRLRSWLVEKPGLMWPQGSELREAETALVGSRAEIPPPPLGIFNSI